MRLKPLANIVGIGQWVIVVGHYQCHAHHGLTELGQQRLSDGAIGHTDTNGFTLGVHEPFGYF